MKILRYTDKVQEQLHSKTKPEPWLHVAIQEWLGGGYYAIYVWDTRQVIEADNFKAHNATEMPRIHGVRAVDNHASLNGNVSPYLAEAMHADAPDSVIPVEHAGDYEAKLKNWRKLSPAAKRGCELFAKEMIKKYGKFSNYARWLYEAKQLAKQGRDWH